MNKKIVMKISIFLFLCLLFSFSFSACSKEEATVETTMTTIPVSLPEITYPAAIETTLPPQETLPDNRIPVVWDETVIEGGKLMKVVDTDILKVRIGPGTTFDQISELTEGMQIRVSAVVDNSVWYKTEEGGYYLSGDYLAEVTS